MSFFPSQNTPKSTSAETSSTGPHWGSLQHSSRLPSFGERGNGEGRRKGGNWGNSAWLLGDAPDNTLRNIWHIVSKLSANDWCTLDKDERVNFWDQKVKVQGHGWLQYAGKCTFCLLTQYPENYCRTKFQQTLVIGVREAKDELIRSIL